MKRAVSDCPFIIGSAPASIKAMMDLPRALPRSFPHFFPGTFARLAAFLLALTGLMMASTAQAQSILRDAETEKLLDDMSAPIIQAAGLQPRNVKIVLVNDKDINAFVAGGQIVYIHSGLITAADNANEVQGVIAHELGHITGGHIIRYYDGAKQATAISLLSMLAGIAAAAAGAGEAGMAAMALGQQAAYTNMMSFSQTQEASADAAGATYLAGAGVSGKGSIAFFKKLQNLEYRYNAGMRGDGYGRTHPMTGERIQRLSDGYQKDPAWEKATDPALEARFQRAKAKLIGYVEEPARTLQLYPERDQSVPGHYARAYAWHKSAYPDKAMAEVNALAKRLPDDPYVLELQGQVLLESGRPKESLAPLRRAVALSNNQPLIAATFGHALIATEDSSNFAEATRILKNAVARDNDNPFAWYQLGVVYQQQGDEPRAALATAERYNLEGQHRLALPNAETAMAGLPAHSADWLRAQDIAMVARAEIARDKKRK